MMYKYVGDIAASIGELGIVEPGQIFEVNNKELEEAIFKSILFEVVKKEVKKVVKKEKDGD